MWIELLWNLNIADTYKIKIALIGSLLFCFYLLVTAKSTKINKSRKKRKRIIFISVIILFIIIAWFTSDSESVI